MFAALHEAEPGTFYLTDFLAKHFDALVWGSLGLDRHPELRDMYFGNYRRVVLLSQTDDPAVVEAGRRAAEMLGLEFEHVHVGRRPFAEAVSVERCSGGSPDAAPRAARAARSSPSTGATSRPRSTARTGASATRCCCRRSSSAPSTAPSARPASTPPRKTSPSGTARARRCDDHVLAAEAQAAALEAEYSKEYLGKLAYAGGFVADMSDGDVDKDELMALEELEDERRSEGETR